MLLSAGLLRSLLLASVVVALPSRPSARVARRRENHQSQPNSHVEYAARSTSNIEYSSNWSGAVWEEGSGTFTSVTGTFTVPDPSGSTGASAAAWVGIDGWTCTTAILQTGVDFTVSSGNPTFDAWYEAYPEPAGYFSGITISAGDVIKLNVTASFPSSGTITVENLTNGQTVSKSLLNLVPLCGQNAEWIVEAYVQNGNQVPLADFGTVTFTNAEATSSGTGTHTPSGATILEMQQNNQVLTSVSTSGSSVTINYV